MSRCSRSVLITACLTVLLAGAVAAQVHTLPVTPNASFLHKDPFDSPADALPIPLAGLGLTPGSIVKLQSSGDWDNGPGLDVHFHFAAVFSASPTLLAGTERYRVPDALGVGIDQNMGVTCPNADSMDTPQDFRIDTTGVVVTIPLGATHLFVMPLDCYSVDNNDPDGDCALKITVIALAGVGRGVAQDAPMAYPNPFRSGTTVRLTLPAAGPVQLAVHDLAGRKVRTLGSGEWAAGAHEVRWDGLDESGAPVARGAYFVRLEDSLGARTVRVSAIR